MAKLMKLLTIGQKSSSRGRSKHIQKCSDQFCKRGNKEQLINIFNTAVEEHLEVANKELGKLEPYDEEKKDDSSVHKISS